MASWESDTSEMTLEVRKAIDIVLTPALMPVKGAGFAAAPPPMELPAQLTPRSTTGERICFLLAPEGRVAGGDGDGDDCGADPSRPQQRGEFAAEPGEGGARDGIWCCDCGESPAAEKCGVAARRVVGVLMCFLLLGAIVVLGASFARGVAVDVWPGLGYVAAYLVSSTLTFYLEGGQAARFMAKGLPPTFFNKMPTARAFIALDERDPAFIMNYMGVRQFLTLGTTTVAGAVILPLVDSAWLFGRPGHPAGAVVLLVSHLVFTTTICQVLPQIRAERNLSFLNSTGALLTYYAAAFFGKLFDTSAPALWIHHGLQWAQRKTGCWASDAEIDEQVRPCSITGDEDEDADDAALRGWYGGPEPFTEMMDARLPEEAWQTKRVWKFPRNYRWPAPSRVARRLYMAKKAAANRAAAVAAAPATRGSTADLDTVCPAQATAIAMDDATLRGSQGKAPSGAPSTETKPGTAAASVEDGPTVKDTPRYLLPPAHPLHVPPHIVLTAAHVLANETDPNVDIGAALRELLSVASDGPAAAMMAATQMAGSVPPTPAGADNDKCVDT